MVYCAPVGSGIAAGAAEVRNSVLTDAELAAASRRLARADPVMAALHAEHGPCRLGPRRSSHFTALTRAIVYQQLSGASARAIWGRFADRFGHRPRPETILAANPATLREAGLSASKAASVRALAELVAAGEIPLGRISRLDDEAIIDRLVEVRGIGRWTAEMFLIFQLRRGDVWPVDDLGIRKGYARAYDVGQPSPRELAPLGDRFRPRRTVAAWYLWRAADTITP